MNIITAYIVTFIASFCILVIEIVAGRILAPFVGVSLYTWTSIIGVVLAGISIGAFLGGKLADRYPDRKTLGCLLLLSGVATLFISPVTNLVAAHRFPTYLMLPPFLIWGVYDYAFKPRLDSYTDYYKESDYYTIMESCSQTS